MRPSLKCRCRLTSSQCPTSHGRSIENFIYSIGRHLGIKHIAICLPSKDVESITSPDSTDEQPLTLEYFNKVQTKARRVANLELESLTIVIDDSMMRSLSDHELQDESVVRCFQDIPGSSRLVVDWTARKAQIRSLLDLPHDPFYGPRPPTRWNIDATLLPQCSWGAPQIIFKTAKRNYTKFDVTGESASSTCLLYHGECTSSRFRLGHTE